MKFKILNRFLFSLLVFSIILSLGNTVFAKKRLLVFCKAAGYKHSSIIPGVKAIMKLGKENNFNVDSTSNASNFTPQYLKKYAAVVFINTTGNILDDAQQLVFEKYIRAGGGYVGIHAAADCEYKWLWYGSLVGAYFAGHPAQQMALLNVRNTNTIATKHLPVEWKRKDEWYNFRAVKRDSIHVLITIDEKSYDPGKSYNPGNEKKGDHPVSWYHDFDGGRSFYTALGHVDESFTDPLYLNHLLGGIKYAMGLKKMEL